MLILIIQLQRFNKVNMLFLFIIGKIYIYIYLVTYLVVKVVPLKHVDFSLVNATHKLNATHKQDAKDTLTSYLYNDK